jgi:phosphatidylglycerophosphate synthase
VRQGVWTTMPMRPDRPREQRVPPSAQLPPLSQFFARRFATHSPFWSWILFERLGGVLAYVFARLGIRPAAVTILGGISGIAGATVLGTAADPLAVAVAAVLLLTAYTLDCADGQLARATRTSSARGAWLDVTTDAVVLSFVAASLAVALLGNGGTPLQSLLISGAFGASRAASLLTATQVRAEEGGIPLTGAAGRLRRVYTAAIDTPFVYVLLCASRLYPMLFRAVIILITLLSVIKMIVSARYHFMGMPRPHGRVPRQEE